MVTCLFLQPCATAPILDKFNKICKKTKIYAVLLITMWEMVTC